jgi:hypothetical protein
LHREPVAHADHAPGAAADEVIARRVKHKKIILDRRQMHQAAESQRGDIDKKPKFRTSITSAG